MKFTQTLVIVTGIASLLAACGNAQPINPTPVPDLPTPAPPTFEVQRGLVARGVEFNARVQPASSETLAFQTDGRLYKLNVKEGDKVKAGDILAELDLTDLKAQLEQETIRLRTAQAVLSNTVTTFSETVRLAQLDLEQAKLRYEVARTRAGGDNGVLNNDLKRIDKRIAEIENSIKQARANFDQAGADNAAKILEEALIERERVLASLSDADRGLRALELEARLLAADVERAEIRVRQLKGTIDPAQIEAIETARIAVESTQGKILNGSLVAPFEGEVGLISIKVGDNVRALSPLMVVAKPGDLELVATPTEEQLNEISLGQVVSVQFLGVDSEPILGSIAKVPIIGNEATGSGIGSQGRARVVRIELSGKPKMESGALARVKTQSSAKEGVLWVPPQVVRTFRARRFVVVRKQDGTEQRVDVKTGLEGGDRLEILDGLKEGDIVVSP